MSQVILNKAGPLPLSVTIPWPSSETVLVAVSGSAWTKTPNSNLAVQLSIHDTTIGVMQLAGATAGAHMALPAGFFAVDGGYGSTTVTLSAANSTTIGDQNDTFTIALIF